MEAALECPKRCAKLIVLLIITGGVSLFLLPRLAVAQVSVTAPAQLCIAHDMTAGDQTFSSAIWQAENGSSIIGATLALACGPFVHETLSDRRVDAQLTLSVQSQTAGAGWIPIVSTATTNIGLGSLTAVVVAASVLSGNAAIQVQAALKGTDPDTLVAGEYRATVIGTITAN